MTYKTLISVSALRQHLDDAAFVIFKIDKLLWGNGPTGAVAFP